MEILEKALAQGQTTLSEHESKQVLAACGVPVTADRLASSEPACVEAAQAVGYPVVIKGSSADATHKTEKNLVRVDVRNDEEAKTAYGEITQAMGGAEVLVCPLVSGQRELVAGLTTDPQFGPCVMFGLGGIFTEILEDVAFRVAPLTERDARDLLDDIQGKKILGPVRGMPAADTGALVNILLSIGKLGVEHDCIQEVDINPLKIDKNGAPIAVDALIVLKKA